MPEVYYVMSRTLFDTGKIMNANIQIESVILLQHLKIAFI